MNRTAQISCAEYLKRNYDYKRMEMDDALKHFIKTCYYFDKWQNIKFDEKLRLYDAIYKTDPKIFITHAKRRAEKSRTPVVISDVRYIDELNELRKMDFIVVRVTTNVKEPPIRRLAKSANEGSVAVSLMYDKSFAVNHSVDFSVNWTSKATTGNIMEPLIARIINKS